MECRRCLRSLGLGPTAFLQDQGNVVKGINEDVMDWTGFPAVWRNRTNRRPPCATSYRQGAGSRGKACPMARSVPEALLPTMPPVRPGHTPELSARVKHKGFARVSGVMVKQSASTNRALFAQRSVATAGSTHRAQHSRLCHAIMLKETRSEGNNAEG